MIDDPPPDTSPGWEAIDRAVAALYPEQEPQHWGTLIKFALGGPDPLDGVSAYRSDRPRPHWHYVSYGMSELYSKTTDNAEWSGWGCEFTFRLARKPEETTPPVWPLNLLQNLARYVFNTGNLFAPGHHLPLNGPIALDEPTALQAAFFMEDPELGSIETPHGKVQFLQLVGATLDELSAARGWKTLGVVEQIATLHPLCVTDLARPSILRDPAAAAVIAEAMRREGSHCGSMSVAVLAASRAADGWIMTVGAIAVAELVLLLRGRLGFDRPFDIYGGNTQVRLAPGDHAAIEPAGSGWKITLTRAAAAQLADSLRPRHGAYAIPGLPDSFIRVVASEIKDSSGKTVIDVIGA